MEYKNTKRSGVLFIFLNIVTATVFSWFSLPRIRREVNSFTEEGKKSGPYFPMWLLGFLTLGVVPIAYSANLARKIDAKAKELGLASTTSFANLFNLTFFGSLFIFGPWIAYSRMFATLNRVETKLNDLAEPTPAPAKEESAEAPAEEAVGPNEIKIRYAGGKKVSDSTKWRVVDRKTKEVNTFDSQSEAIAYAMRVAKKRGVGVKVNGRVDKKTGQ
ncbi:MAG: DUF2188 domain-containing protein [Bacilli bacterium]|nr:DUF2188 domain-containing protein [Bacilli bacterium]